MGDGIGLLFCSRFGRFDVHVSYLVCVPRRRKLQLTRPDWLCVFFLFFSYQGAKRQIRHVTYGRERAMAKLGFPILAVPVYTCSDCVDSVLFSLVTVVFFPVSSALPLPIAR